MKTGDIVELKHQPGRYAVIERLYDDVRGGVRLDRILDGFFSWNVKDLQVATPPAASPLYKEAADVKKEAEAIARIKQRLA